MERRSWRQVIGRHQPTSAGRWRSQRVLRSVQWGHAELILDEAGPVRLIARGVVLCESTDALHSPTYGFILERARGFALVCGLGIGYVCRLIYEQVEHCDVIERDSDVIALCSRFVDAAKTTIIHADIDDYLRRCRKTYDFMYLDHRGTLPVSERKHYESLTAPLLSRAGEVLFWEPRTRGERRDQACRAS